MGINTNLPYLVEDSSAIERARRIEEQRGTCAVTGLPVKPKDHTADYQVTPTSKAVSGECFGDNGVEPHPKFLKNQAYDGRDPELIVLTNLRPGEAAEIAEQLKLQNELRLGLQHGKKFDPKPSF